MRGNNSNAFSSGMMTSVITRSPSPADAHRHSVAALPVVRTRYPARPSAWLSTVRIAASSSATMYRSGDSRDLRWMLRLRLRRHGSTTGNTVRRGRSHTRWCRRDR